MHTYLLTAWLNQNTRESFEDGYADHHDLAISETGLLQVQAKRVAGAAEAAFEMLNDRQGATERSLSVGDVVHIVDEQGLSYWLACQPTGWTMLDEAPRNAVSITPTAPSTRSTR